MSPNDIPPRDLRVTTIEIDGQTLVVLSHATQAPDDVLGGLPASEREVLRHVLEGRSQQEIAGLRGTSPRTVAKQIERAYRRLGVRSKAELAALIADRRGPA